MRVDSLENIIFDTIKGIDTIEKYGKFLEFYGRGNIYCFSPENAIAIFAQNPKAALVGTYDMWKRYGRYPLKNVGIAVYPYNTSGVFGKFADYVYDVKDTKSTKGQEISMWKLSEEQRKEYFEWKQENYYREEAQGFVEYLKLQFYEDAENSLSERHSELLYEDKEACHAVKRLLCESIMKVYMTRCGMPYQISDDAGKSFHELLFEGGAMRVMFLMKCIKVVQEVAHKEIQQVNYYFRNGRKTRNDAKKSGEAVKNPPRAGKNIGGTERTLPVGEADNRIFHGEVSGTDSDSARKPRNGETSRPESEGGMGVFPEDVSGEAGEGAGLADGYITEDTEGEPDPAGNPKYDRNRNIIPSTQLIEAQADGQLNIFSYINSITDNNVSIAAVTLDGLGLRQLEQAYRQPLDKYVDLILSSGVCGYRLEARYNIFNYYSARYDGIIGLTAARNFVRKQYLGASLGFVIEGQKVSVFYDNDGMKLAYGEESRLCPQRIVSWNEVVKRIFTLIREGRFIDAGETELAKESDEKGLITDIIYYIRDGFQGVDIATLPEPFNEVHSFPDLEEEVRVLLHSPERASQLLDVMKKMWDDCEKGLLQPHWAYAHEYQRVEHLEYYLEGYTVFELPEHIDTLKIDFVPLDAFDKYAGIIADAGRAGDVERKYDYFLSSEEGNNISGLLQCMKRKFGEYSGEGYRGFQRSYTSRGFQIEIAKEYSNPFEDKAVRLLSSRAVAKRICSIMKSGRFFIENELVNYPEWKNRKRSEEREKEDRILDTEKEAAAGDFFYPADWEPNRGSDAKRCSQNIEAIRMLKKLEKEKRQASYEEQVILSKYVGWGGLSKYFDENAKNVQKQFKELKDLLTEEEYISARASVTDSFYTPRVVLDGVYQALERFGFRGGNILEPSMGIGNFFSAMPEDMKKKSTLSGVEIDAISGRIAKLLHPNCDIQICGIENAQLPPDYYDVVIGNVPFGNYKVNDKKYNKENFLIHDYFFAKAIEYCVPGGIICFITSKGTLDKKNSAVRRYISERAEFIGAIRLPATTFWDSAHTVVTSDLIFLRKKERASIITQEFEFVEQDGRGIPINSYYISHPDMMLGEIEVKGATSYLAPDLDQWLLNKLYSAVYKLPSNIYLQRDRKEMEESYADIGGMEVIPADSSIKNYTYTVQDGRLFMREGSSLLPQNHLPAKVKACVIRLCEIRKVVHELIDMQVEGCSKEELEECQGRLNQLYDVYVEEYGYFNEQYTKKVFCDDVEYPLLCALEEKEGEKYVKAKIFSQQTIHPDNVIENVESAIEALNVTVANYGYVNMENILRIYPRPLDDVIMELRGAVYLNPEKYDEKNPLVGFETKEEYLSGDVRKKLAVATIMAESNEKFKENAAALESVIPKDVDATEIQVKLGASWVAAEDYQKFIYEKFKIQPYMERYVYVEYNSLIHSYFIQGKSSVRTVEVKETYGTDRMNALEIFENLLNQRQLKVLDRVEKPDGKVSYVANQNATTLVRAKGEQIKEEFSEWLFSDMERREKYVRLYNDRFNNMCLREYDGSYLTFPGMNQNFSLRPHQKNAVARIIRGGNTLLDHCVGGGKSFIMAAAAMEMKRLGLANKVMIVVPNHLTSQIAGEFLKLYPAANILLTTKKDFEKNNRKRFVSKIATGEYDGVIIGFSQFEKIPISKERRHMMIQKELDEVKEFIASLRQEKKRSWSVKQMQSYEKNLRRKLEILGNEDYKDDVIAFEELGIDALMVDEAHYFKNLSFTTKMGNISGINPNGSQRAYDMLLKCNYINEISPGRSVVFSTATPISNSICEMYQMQKYLQGELLRERGLYHFDAWAANFGETVSSMELSPEGKGYREKTRFAKFTNIPELVTAFRMVADVKTQSMLSYLDIPSLINNSYDICQSEASEDIIRCIDEFVERADRIRTGNVDPSVDNMLKVCHDAKLVSTDIRLLYPNAEPDIGSKLYKVAENVFRIYNETMEEKGTQVIFSDIGVPNGGKGFNVYQFIKDELVSRGMPADEICFIHEAKNEKQREDMFQDVRNGIKRVIIGSTEKMGTGTNIQTRLYAMHEIDVPWRPSDVEQREGRILRQGNMYKEVHIFRYVTKKTFDAYNWSIIENKQKFISQILNGEIVERKCVDIDEAVLNFAEMKAIASGNPLIKEKIEIDAAVSRLSLLKKSFTMGKYQLEREYKHILPERQAKCEECIQKVKNDIAQRDGSGLYKGTGSGDSAEKDSFLMLLNGQQFTERKKAGEYLSIILKSLPLDGKARVVGEYAGFAIAVCKNQVFTTISGELQVTVCGNMKYSFDASTESGLGNILKMQNAVRGLEKKLNDYEQRLEETNQALLATKKEYEKPFAKEEELAACLQRQQELTELLSLDEDKEQKAVIHHKSRKVM